jgi:uncharacterized membrane protein
MEGTFIGLLVLAVLVMPVVALAVAIFAAVRASRLEKSSLEKSEEIQREVNFLRDLVRKRDKRLAEIESLIAGAAAVPAAPAAPAATEPQPPATVSPPAATAPSAPIKTPEPPPPARPQAPPAVQAPPPPRIASGAVLPPPPHPPSPPAKPSLGFEELLGTKGLVWVGAVALALAGVFLVKLSIDMGLLSPAVRIILGVLFGLGLLGLGEALRKRYSLISQGCSAAGIADLFACFLAAVNLYKLIGPLAGFGLMALTTAVAVALSLRQGPLVAVLGLIGGFFTPYWIHIGEPRPAPLFGYLFMLEAGLLLVTRKRRWWPLAALTLLGSVLWVAAWLAVVFKPEHAVWLGFFLLASVAAFLGSGFAGGAARAWGDVKIPLGLGYGAAGSALVLLAALAGAGHYGTTEWAFLGMMGAACLVLGRSDSSFEGLAWMAAAIPALMLISWSAAIEPAQTSRFVMTSLLMGLLFSAGAYAALWRAVHSGRWASLSAASAIIYFLVTYQGSSRLVEGFHWGLPSMFIGAAYLVAALPVARQRGALKGGEEALAAMAVSITAFVSLAVPMELERQWLSVAWAIEVAALCWLGGKLKVAALGHLAWAMAALVAARLLMNPAVLAYPIGTTPVFNWLLYGYGIPLLAFAAGACLCAKESPKLSQALQWGSIAFGFALASLEIRHYFHPSGLASGSLYLAEWGAYVSAWLALGLGLTAAFKRWPITSIELSGKILAALGIFAALFGPCLIANPLWEHHSVGATPIFNSLLFVYGLPAILVFAIAASSLSSGHSLFSKAAGVSGLILLFVLLTLEIRQAYHGAELWNGATPSSENYAYSAAWVLFGTALLIVGIFKSYPVFRYASLSVMLLAVAKVFLYDMGNLPGIYRVLSFLVVGAFLIFLAFLYQKFVYKGSAA